MKAALQALRLGATGASMIAFEREERHFDWNWHYHPEVELTWIIKGSGRRLVGDHAAEYRSHDLVLVGSNLPHTWVSNPSARQNRAMVVQFRPDIFPESLLRLPEFGTLAGLLAQAARGLCFRAAAARRVGPEMTALASGGRLANWLGLARVLDQLATRGDYEVLATAGYQDRRSYRMNTRLQRVTDFIEENFRDELTLAQAARHAGLSPSAFSQFFHRMTHQTFVAYRTACRVRAACRLLVETDRPITDLAFACGFGNLANFNRRFAQEKKMTPRAYRRLYDQPGGSGAKPPFDSEKSEPRHSR